MKNGLVAIGAAGAAAVVLVIVGAVVAVRGCGGEAPRATADPGTGNGNAIAGNEGLRARGTAELRQLGCEHATVVDMARLLGDAGRVREGEPRTVVTCDVPAAGDAPGCERVAATYFGAIGGVAEDKVGVRVLRAGARLPSCSRLYAPNGADLGSF